MVFASLFFFPSLSPFFVLWVFFCNSSRLQLCSPFFHSFLVRYCFTAFICLFNLLLFANKIFWLLCMASHVDTSPHKQPLESHSHHALSFSVIKSSFVLTYHSSGFVCVLMLCISARHFLSHQLERVESWKYKRGMKHSIKLVFLRIRNFSWEKPVFMYFH